MRHVYNDVELDYFMRTALFLATVITLAACDVFSDPDNRRPIIVFGQLYSVDTLDVYEVTMRVGAADPDNNLEGIDCEGDLDYVGPSPADTTVTFPFSDVGREVFSECFATDTEGASSDTLLLHMTLPDTSQSKSGAF